LYAKELEERVGTLVTVSSGRITLGWTRHVTVMNFLQHDMALAVEENHVVLNMS
jgi:hypothetical protein